MFAPMCRWVAYRGKPIFLSQVVTEPCRSLIQQSLHAREAHTNTHGDGFGMGWYGEWAEPGLYRELLPAWGDENLRHLARQIRSPLFFAHVRAATGTAIARANCHPFAHGPMLFMHNGQIGNYGAVRRAVEALIPDELYAQRGGTTDSEALFLAMLARGAASDTVAATSSVLAEVAAILAREGATEPLRFTAALTDGRDLFCFRFASDDAPPSLYFRETADGLLVVSEPLDDDIAGWREVPAGHVLEACGDGTPHLRPFSAGLALAA